MPLLTGMGPNQPSMMRSQMLHANDISYLSYLSRRTHTLVSDNVTLGKISSIAQAVARQFEIPSVSPVQSHRTMPSVRAGSLDPVPLSEAFPPLPVPEAGHAPESSQFWEGHPHCGAPSEMPVQLSDHLHQGSPLVQRQRNVDRTTHLG
jgi:hypothetical protein